MEQAELPMTSSNLKVKTAWLYYVEGLTQEQIAEKLQVSRVKVMRTLAACTSEGIVVTTINGVTAEQIALERELEKRWNLSSAIVIPTPSSEEHLETAIGHAVASYLGESMQDGMTLAIGGGATLYASLRFIEKRQLKDASVVALVGSLPHSRWVNPSIVAARVAEAYGVDSYQITAPVVVDNASLRDALWQQASLKDVKQRAEAADIALLTVGGITPESTIFRHDILPASLIGPLTAKGAVANILCYVIDAEGRLIDHEVNRQIMAIDLPTVARIPNVVLAAGGTAKTEAIRAALKVVAAKVLITDSDTAAALLAKY
ncbi:sugar-binding transcriptional regulator [Phyllobacterium sp. 0TCS1.6C]|uniref:sugar-binding transcriptional regulator n=2 Tax=unclassified Phyllobacterium TaxID=2638441 RepID=UPI00226416A7|nr:sugar-binding domain-containing protein [Phyllobacterium sp. 0TCS1.6C]MCX8281458.1 sugar-binding transcriptional regulator [Phyllobacterium sp. 0TCS1.6C]